jgi:hypothetical protein
MSDKDEPDAHTAAHGLRLIKTPERKPPEQSPTVKAMLDDMRRRESGSRARAGRDRGGKDAA